MTKLTTIVLIGLWQCAGFSWRAMSAPAAQASETAANTNAALPRLWQPVSDTPFLQEIGRKILTHRPVSAVAIHGGTAYAVVGGVLKSVNREKLEDAHGAPCGIRRMKSLWGALWAITDQGVFRFSENEWKQIDKQPFRDFCIHLGEVYG